MNNKEIIKIIESILLIMGGESITTLESKFGIEQDYVLRAGKIFRILKEEPSPEENPNFTPLVKIEKIKLK